MGKFLLLKHNVDDWKLVKVQEVKYTKLKTLLVKLVPTDAMYSMNFQWSKGWLSCWSEAPFYIPKHLGYFLILKVMSQSSRVEKTICGKLMLLPCTPLTQKSLGTAHSSYLWSKGQTYLTLAVVSHRFSLQKLFIVSVFSQWEKSSD